MTALAGPDRASRHDPLGEQVAAAAQHAWEVHGERLDVRSTPVNGHAHMTSLAAVHARRVEFVVEHDDPHAWDVLAGVKAADSWQLCALVPLGLLGKAHERLREHGYELQGWWVTDGEVAFGNVEIA